MKIVNLLVVVVFLLLTMAVGYFSLPFEVVGHSVETSFLLTAKRLERALIGMAAGVALLLTYDTFFRRRFNLSKSKELDK
jgi:hypothetical protein